MRFSIPLAAVFLATVIQAGVTQPDKTFALAERSDVDDVVMPLVDKRSATLEKKACKYNGCKCNSRGKQLTVCGNCVWANTQGYVVTSKRVNNHIYECSPTGNCCDYGVGSDCGTGGARCIKY